MRTVPALALLLACAESPPAEPVDSEPVVDDVLDPVPDVPKSTSLWVEEALPAATTRKVDVLLVLDTSCSMLEERDDVAENGHALLDRLLPSELDWHVGMVTMDTEDPDQNGKLVGFGGYRWVDAATPRPDEVLEALLSVPSTRINASATERGLLAAYRAIVTPTQSIRDHNRGFYREDASLHLVFVSDEEDQSSPEIRRNEFAAWLSTLKEDTPFAADVSALVGPMPTGCQVDADTVVPGSIYLSLVASTGGVVGSICEPDWAGFLHEVGERATGGGAYAVTGLVPEPETMLARLELDLRDEPPRVWHGVRDADLQPYETVADACARAGLVDCFGYAVDRALPGIRYLEGWRPHAAATLKLRYRGR